MIVRALSKGVGLRASSKMITRAGKMELPAGPKGQQQIRAADHAMLQPMFLVRLSKDRSAVHTTTTIRLRAKYTAPPVR